MNKATKYTHIFVDFDETLFNHYAYADWADKVLADVFKQTPGFFKSRFEEFHDQLEDPLLRLFRHNDHVKAVTGKGWDYVSGELEKALLQSNLDFCYPDSHQVLKQLAQSPYDVRILTFGDGEYQRYKINTCNVINRLGIPVHVVQEAKRDFLAREFPKVKGLMIDDKYPLHLPPNWGEIHIARQQKLSQPVKVSGQVMRVSSLKQALELVT